jgi:hypothetical protein
MSVTNMGMDRDSSVGIATGWTAGVRFPVGARDVSVIHIIQTGSGAQSPIQSIPGEVVKRSGHEADHSPPSSAEDKNGGAILPLPPYLFTVC